MPPVLSKKERQQRWELLMANHALNASNGREAVLLHGFMTNDFLESFDEQKYGARKKPARRKPEKPEEKIDPTLYLEQLYSHGSATLTDHLNPDTYPYAGAGIGRWPNDIDLVASPGETHEALAQFCTSYHQRRGGECIVRFGVGGDEWLREKAIHKEKQAKGLHTAVMLLTLTPEMFRDILSARHRSFFSSSDRNDMREWLEKDGKKFRQEIVDRFNQAYAVQLENDRHLHGRGWEKIVHCTPDRLCTVIGID